MSNTKQKPTEVEDLRVAENGHISKEVAEEFLLNQQREKVAKCSEVVTKVYDKYNCRPFVTVLLPSGEQLTLQSLLSLANISITDIRIGIAPK